MSVLDQLRAQQAEIQKEIQQLENRQKRLAQEHNQLIRKARTRRLIERGALLESMIPEAETLTNERVKVILLAVFHTTAADEALAYAREQAP